MKNLFEIDESEKKRILEMHETATKKQYLFEQNQEDFNKMLEAFKNYPCIVRWAGQPTNWGKITGYSYEIPKIPSVNIGNFATFYNNGSFMTITDNKKYFWDCNWFQTNFNKFVSTNGAEGLPESEGTTEYGSYQGETKRYTKSKNVTTFQNALNMVGYDSGKADGKFGPKTKTALETFQKEYGLDSSLGKMDKSTATKLIEVLKVEKPDESGDIQTQLSAVTSSAVA